jgi:hypothetical protein
MKTLAFRPCSIFLSANALLVFFCILFAPCQGVPKAWISTRRPSNKQMADAAVDKLFNAISNAAEEQLKKATYFDELLRDLEPLGTKLRGTSFNETARSIYNTYKKAYDLEGDPVKAREKLNEKLKGDIRAQVTNMMISSLDKWRIRQILPSYCWAHERK